MSREEDAYVIERMGKLLAEIAIIVNGTEPHDTLWSYHDLPEKVRALRQAQQPAAAVPEGYALVPVEPTQGMLDAAGMCIVPDGKEWLDQSNRGTWAAMLAAAPAQKPAAAKNPKEK